jgi:hypothetical protein
MDKKVFSEVDQETNNSNNHTYPTNPSKPTDLVDDKRRSLNDIIVQDRLFKTAYTEKVFRVSNHSNFKDDIFEEENLITFAENAGMHIPQKISIRF